MTYATIALFTHVTLSVTYVLPVAPELPALPVHPEVLLQLVFFDIYGDYVMTGAHTISVDTDIVCR